MGFSDFCTALYVRRAPLGSQTKFVQALLKSSGCTYIPDEAYCKKLYSGANLLSLDIRQSFPNPLPASDIEKFLRDYLTKTSDKTTDIRARCMAVASKAGLPTTLTVDPDAFVPALSDWFRSTVETPDDCDVLAVAYQRRLAGERSPDLATFTPLYAGDAVIVSTPPAQQKHSAPFWGEFTHEWVLQNTGKVAWTGRSLVCTNPNDNGIRPTEVRIQVPGTAPQGFAKPSIPFKAHGHEGTADSHWQMVDDQGNNCFPNHSSTFDVRADVMNPVAQRSEIK